MAFQLRCSLKASRFEKQIKEMGEGCRLPNKEKRVNVF